MFCKVILAKKPPSLFERGAAILPIDSLQGMKTSFYFRKTKDSAKNESVAV